MLNRIGLGGSDEAKVRYLESDFQIIAPGSHVKCAITGESIPSDELKYWSFERQEAYVDAHASLEAEQRAGRFKDR